jgi:hypothetical protein
MQPPLVPIDLRGTADSRTTFMKSSAFRFMVEVTAESCEEALNLQAFAG